MFVSSLFLTHSRAISSVGAEYALHVHYGKNRRCRAANHCREALHGKDIFSVRSKKHGKDEEHDKFSG
jgi:hypothetical protein